MREIIGWLTPEVGAAMRNLIWKVKPDVCVEIGVFAGKSLLNTALALKENGKGIVYGIDPWRMETAIAGSSPEEFDWEGSKIDLDAVHWDCMRAIWQHEVDDHVVIIRATSSQARHLFPEASIDVLYIDGGHSAIASSLDATVYLPKVRLGGHIWMDDTNYESLQAAVGIVSAECQLVRDFGHCQLYVKR
jgi:predicted O-methyltransferase YrrM